MSDDNISRSYIKQIPEIKPENIEEVYPKMFEGYNGISTAVKQEKFVPPDYKVEPIDLHSNSANFFLQNDSMYAEVKTDKNSKKNIVLFNK